MILFPIVHFQITMNIIIIITTILINMVIMIMTTISIIKLLSTHHCSSFQTIIFITSTIIVALAGLGFRMG